MAQYKDSATAVVAEVDCTSEDSTRICSDNSIEGYPTLKYGDPSDLQPYEGKRTRKALAAFAKKNLNPTCTPTSLEHCSEDQKIIIEELRSQGSEALKKLVADAEAQKEEIKK